MRYPTYPQYKPSGIEWLGDLPEHWRIRRLKFAAEYRVSSVDKVPSDEELPVRLCNYTDVYYHDHISSEMEFMEATATAEEIRRFQILEGDVLITKDSEDWTDIAVSSLVTETVTGLVCGYHLSIIRPNIEVLLGSYLLRAFQSPFVNGQCQLAATGVTRYGLPKSAIGGTWLPLPPIEEQRSIASFLDLQTSRLDLLIRKKRALIEKLKEKRSALISLTVTRGLPPEDARAVGLDPHLRFKPSGIEWLGDMPEHWEVKRLKHLGTVRYGLGEPPEYVDEGLPFIRATDIKQGRIDLDSVRRVDPSDVPWSRRPQLSEDEILVVRSGAYTGDSAIVPKEISGGIAGFDMVVAIDKACPRFVAWVLLSKYMLEGHIHGSRMRAAQPHLNAEQLGDFTLLIPPLPEQRTIADFLDRATTKIDRLVTKIEEAVERLQEYRSTLIAAAVGGRIDVREVVA